MATNVADHIHEQFRLAIENATNKKVKLYTPWATPTSQWSLQWTPLAMDFHGDIARASSNWQILVVLLAPESAINDFAREIDPTIDGSIMRVLADIESIRWGTWTFSRDVVGDSAGLQLIASTQAQILEIGKDPE